VEGRINSTANDLANLVGPRIVSPGHCTGWRAASALSTTFGPSRFASCVVGTRFVLEAAELPQTPATTERSQPAGQDD
jgi:7,8-dihydropterin-6-yl-methyl-4-(beta-D-ribofuranosyl)aminobenzene 5'-phosphate synthase